MDLVLALVGLIAIDSSMTVLSSVVATLIRYRIHLYRRHKRPVSCPRCCTVFSNEMEIQYHLRQPETCSIQRKIQVEGFDKRQEEHLRTRKRITGTEEQRWKEIYRILFPDDDEGSIPSPC